MADQTYAGMSLTDIAQALHMPNLTDSTVKAVLKDHGITNKSSAQDLQSFISQQGAPDQGGGQSALSGLVHDVSGAVGDVTQPAKQAYDETLGKLTPNVQALVEEGPEGPLESAVTAKVPGVAEALKKDVLTQQKPGPKLPTAAEAAAAAKKKAAAKKTDTTSQPSNYEQLANSLAQMYLQQINQLEPLISGSGIFGPQGETSNVVNAASAAVPGGNSGWLSGLAASEQKDAAGLQGAMSNVGNAEAQGALGVANAVQNTGTANTEYLQSAPYQQLLNELVSQGAYRLSQSGASALPANALTTSPLGEYLFKTAGLGEPTKNGPTVGGANTAAKGGTSGTTSTPAAGNNPTG